MKQWVRSAKFYFDPSILSIFFMGFASGLPFLLTLATLQAWLVEVGVTKTTIGVFALVTIPYSLKFIWAPIVDNLSLPFLKQIFGHRKSWILFSQICLMGALIVLGSCHPENNILMTACAALGVAICSATQDIGVEAYRVEVLEQKYAGIGASASTFGYRLGMWVSGAGALYLADSFNWFVTYCLMAASILIGIVATLFSPAPPEHSAQLVPRKFNKFKNITFHAVQEQLRDAVLTPLNMLLKKNNIVVILCFILFYKIGDTALNVMSVPFLLEIGFTKIDIAHVGKSFGIGAMIIGGLVGGFMLASRPMIYTLVCCALLFVIASLMFMVQAIVGDNLYFLFATIGIENLACGMGATAFITYLSSLCSVPYSGTHFAILTSIASATRVALSYISGYLADHLSWQSFYLCIAFACIPMFLLLLAAAPHFSYDQNHADGYAEA